MTTALPGDACLVGGSAGSTLGPEKAMSNDDAVELGTTAMLRTAALYRDNRRSGSGLGRKSSPDVSGGRVLCGALCPVRRWPPPGA